MVAAIRGEDAVPSHRLLERVIGMANELQPVNFFIRGARVARTVGRISLDDSGRLVPVGTGFFVSPRLLLTNNNMVPTPPGGGSRLVQRLVPCGRRRDRLPPGRQLGPGHHEVITNNPKDCAHSIEGFLADPRVARSVAQPRSSPR